MSEWVTREYLFEENVCNSYPPAHAPAIASPDPDCFFVCCWHVWWVENEHADAMIESSW